MNSISYIAFAVLGILITAYLRQRSSSSRLESLKKRHEIQNPEIKYEYNRFNTKEERNTIIETKNDQFSLITDIQNIRIANQTLVSKVTSEYQELPIQFEVVIQPFEKALFDIDGFKNFNQDGILILWSNGPDTRFPIEHIEELNFLEDVIPMDPQGVFLSLDSFKVDKSENSIILFGKFDDGSEFKLNIDYKSYRLKFVAPLQSIMDFKNFKNIKGLSLIHI